MARREQVRYMIAVAVLAAVVAHGFQGAIPVVAEKTGPIEVRVDPNFELIAMVCHLAGYEEYFHERSHRKGVQRVSEEIGDRVRRARSHVRPSKARPFGIPGPARALAAKA